MKKDIYLLKVDHVCDSCGTKNEIEIALDEPIELIACGRCGKFIKVPKDLTQEDEEAVSNLISNTLKGE